ncbi:MAG: exodeoxyribonuclease III [Woeseiaceae bacterium]|nr:exodeoxyribonuclease III [Woeseiaceae bacterium]
MKVATWNVNSLKVRFGQVMDWLGSERPDVLVLQEIKQVTEDFPAGEFEKDGYFSIASGQKTYNGVAVLARFEPQEPVTDFPGFDDPQRRVLATTVNGLRVVNLYVPNGASLDSDKYQYKLRWLAALREFLASELETHERVVVLGDFNIAPDDRDVYDPEKWGDDVLCSPPEREALAAILKLGFVDVFRKLEPEEKAFSWWDYRRFAFQRNAGLRIDLILADEALAKRCSGCYIDRDPRSWERPSDHTPVVAQFDV